MLAQPIIMHWGNKVWSHKISSYCWSYATGFGKTCIVHTFDFSHLEIHKNPRKWYTNLRLSGMMKEYWFYNPWSFTPICYSNYTLWVSKVEKLDVWTMQVFPNPVTYIAHESYMRCVHLKRRLRYAESTRVLASKLTATLRLIQEILIVSIVINRRVKVHNLKI